MGDTVNILLDNLLSLTWRLLDLPFYVLLPASFLFSLLVWIAFLLLMRLFYIRLFEKKNGWVLGLLIFLGTLAVIVDRKMYVQKQQTNAMNQKYLNAFAEEGEKLGKNIGSDREKLYDQSGLEGIELADWKIWEKGLHSGVDLLIFSKKDPNAVGYVAVVDLEYPGLQIKITPELKEKYLTTTFAYDNDCFLAINGEAGNSMLPKSGFGEWIGNWVVNGKAIKMEDSKDRPFMGFDKSNKAKYFKASIVDTTLTEDKFNTIWGRIDILVDGEILPNRRRPYARTIMGINEEGSKLYLMIVDGKRPEHSLGLTYEEAADVLKRLGATQAMACDQGGSSCMYVKNKGIITWPADSEGIERPIYTHFGIRFRN